MGLHLSLSVSIDRSRPSVKMDLHLEEDRRDTAIGGGGGGRKLAPCEGDRADEGNKRAARFRFLRAESRSQRSNHIRVYR